jgi:N-acetylglutamate synthase and related acetyltransferases
MKEKVTIREFTYPDKEAIISIFRLNTPQYFSPIEETDLIHYLENEIEEYYVLEVGGKVIGGGGINIAEDKITGKISWDLLHPLYQGQGFGTFLLKYRIERLSKLKEIQKITVRTSQLVYRFYEKSDFKLVETVKDYWAEGFDLYKMIYSR